MVTAPPAPPPPPQPLGDRFPAQATFADLVRSAGELLDRERPADCLLAREPAGFQLRAELASSIRPLPLPADDLDALLKQSDRAELLGAWGRHGDGSARLALVSFTLAAPTREGVAIVATDRGLSVRGASTTGLIARDELDLGQAVAALAQLPNALVFVAAEARYPLSKLAALLGALAQREVTLATNLSADTSLRPRAPTRVTRCPEGLPNTTEPEGALPTPALREGVAPLAEAGADCLLSGDARGAAGGRLTLGLRIDAQGKVATACVVRDELADDAVAGCVTELAHRLTFPPPSPAGVVDVELPVALRPGPRVVQPALCAP
ncbi:MAG TPA: hypothetical protein VFX59_27345 [Polyangiales bacterium]|nr:hypothetical protein [Polyangiales bacterium]